MATTKKSFVLYKDFRSVLCDMTDEQAGKLFKAIYEYQDTGVVVDVPPELTFLFKQLVSQFKRDDSKWGKVRASRSESGRKGGLAKQANARSAKQTKQKVANQAVSVTVTGTVNGTVTEKIKPLTTGASVDGATKEEVWISHHKRKLSGKRLKAFKLVWEAFGYKKGRASAIDAFLDIPELTESLVAEIVDAAECANRGRSAIIAKGSTPIFLQGWISGRRWEDEDTSSSVKPTKQRLYAPNEVLKDWDGGGKLTFLQRHSMSHESYVDVLKVDLADLSEADFGKKYKRRAIDVRDIISAYGY